MIDFDQINEVHKLALKHSVSYSLQYHESDTSWYFIIFSAAKSENWIGKNRSSFKLAVEETIERLKSYG